MHVSTLLPIKTQGEGGEEGGRIGTIPSITQMSAPP
jgi:hypothetical protein